MDTVIILDERDDALDHILCEYRYLAHHVAVRHFNRTVRHDHDHRHHLTFCHEIIQNQTGCTYARP